MTDGVLVRRDFPPAEPFLDRQAKQVAPGQLNMPWNEAIRADHCCVWPTWGPDKSTGAVCGLQTLTYGPPKREKESPYCEFHHQKAYPAYSPIDKE